MNHTQMVEQKLYKYRHEINCDIMMLVKRDNEIKLMSLKLNPWLPFDNQADDKKNAKKNIYRMQMFAFTGSINLDNESRNILSTCDKTV